jgi:hypothetical protein
MSDKVIDIVPDLDKVRDVAVKQLGRRISNLTRTAEIADIPMVVVLIGDNGAVYYTNPAAYTYYLIMSGALDEVKANLRGEACDE